MLLRLSQFKVVEDERVLLLEYLTCAFVVNVGDEVDIAKIEQNDENDYVYV